MTEPPRASVPPAVSVIVTVLNDRRVERTLRSLQAQTISGFEVIFADGGSTDGTFELAQRLAAEDPRIRPLRLPGNIPGTRNQALAQVRGRLVAFLDADEVAPPGWLSKLIAPFSDPKVGFTGGPTPGMRGTVESLGARYYDAYLRKFYDTVAREHPHALPMGNSAWRREVFQTVGKLDTTLYPKAASEDQDMALRTLQAGWKGVYVAEAGVDHDFSDMRLRNLLKKQATYATGGYVLWRRRGTTYEASTGRLLPYLAGPVLLVAGGLLWVSLRGFSAWRLVGPAVVALGALELLGLEIALAMQGRREERQYPGMRYRPVELLRRWATLWGAARGLWHYGLSGRRNLPAGGPSPSNEPAPAEPERGNA